MFNIKSGKVEYDKSKNKLDRINQFKISNFKKEFDYDFKNNLSNNDLENKEIADDPLDKEIYAKFLLFLEFQERMKERR